MPVYVLSKDIVFPPVEFAESDGLLAIGGDLQVERLLLAYNSGIFPWYSEGEPICWYATNPRFVLFPAEFKRTKSLTKLYASGRYHIRMNTCFEVVLESCASVYRFGQNGTWITDEMKQAYTKLHKMGIAQSVEVYNDAGILCGGLYGLLLGSVFAGESMFSKESNTSKLALFHLCSTQKLEVIDCQVYTEHLSSLGARMIPLQEYLQILNK